MTSVRRRDDARTAQPSHPHRYCQSRPGPDFHRRGQCVHGRLTRSLQSPPLCFWCRDKKADGVLGLNVRGERCGIREELGVSRISLVYESAMGLQVQGSLDQNASGEGCCSVLRDP